MTLGGNTVKLATVTGVERILKHEATATQTRFSKAVAVKRNIVEFCSGFEVHCTVQSSIQKSITKTWYVHL